MTKRIHLVLQDSRTTYIEADSIGDIVDLDDEQRRSKEHGDISQCACTVYRKPPYAGVLFVQNSSESIIRQLENKPTTLTGLTVNKEHYIIGETKQYISIKDIQTLLVPAVRQYRHNTDSNPGFIAGYDVVETIKILSQLINGEIELAEQRST